MKQREGGVGDRERQRQRQRQRGRERDRRTDRQTERERDRDRERQREKHMRAYTHKANLLITITLQVGWLGVKGIHESVLVTLIETLAACDTHKRVQVLLQRKLISYGSLRRTHENCTSSYVNTYINLITLACIYHQSPFHR